MRLADEELDLSLVGLPGEAVLVTSASRLILIRVGFLATGFPHRMTTVSYPLCDLRMAQPTTGTLAGRLTLTFGHKSETTQRERIAFGRRDFDRFRVAARMLDKMAQAAPTPAELPTSVRQVAAAGDGDPANAVHDETASLLRALSRLADEGLISAEEFRDKRHEVLRRL